IDGAIERFDKARKLDWNLCEANYELALCYMTKDYATARIYAGYALDRALGREPENTVYLFALVKLKRMMGLNRDPIDILNRILEIDPEHHEARRLLAQMYTDSEWDRNPEKAEQHILELAERAPETPDIHYMLGKAYYENEDYTQAEPNLLQQLDSNSDHALAKLLLGWTYLKMENYEKATDFYLEGLRGLDDPEKMDEIDNVMWVLFTDEERQACGSLLLNERGDFYADLWKRRDPNILTAENERLIEHLNRLDYVKKYFAYPNYRGYDDMGEIYLKYGEPGGMKTWHTFMEETSANVRGTNYAISREQWIYINNDPPVYFDFEISKGGHTYQVPQKGVSNFDTSSLDIGNTFVTDPFIFHDMRLAPPEQFMYSYPDETFDFPVEVWQFRGVNDRTALELYYGIPYEELQFKQEEDQRIAESTSHVVVSDTLGNRINDRTRTDRYAYREASGREREIAIDYEPLRSVPGVFRFGLSLTPGDSSRTGIMQFTLPVRDFTSENLMISDIVVLGNTDLPAATPDKRRHDLNLIPYLFNDWTKTDPLMLYFEIYNLTLVNNSTNYTVSYSIKKIEKEGTFLEGIVQGVGKILTGGPSEIKITHNRAGTTDESYEVISLDISDLDEGESVITVTITDTYSGQAANVSRTIDIVSK
ncbi:GWxTD domain-containing protein, partial [candidate division KSB1 bacterium]